MELIPLVQGRCHGAKVIFTLRKLARSTLGAAEIKGLRALHDPVRHVGAGWYGGDASPGGAASAIA